MILNDTESQSVWRSYFFSLIIVGGLILILIALAYRQLSQGMYWNDQMAQSSIRSVKLPAPRGMILDRNQVVLVDNRPSYNAALYLYEFKTGRNPEKLLKAVHGSVEILKKRMKIPVNINDNTVRRHYEQRGPLPLTVWNDLSPAALAAFEERSPWMQGVDLQIEPVRFYPFGTLASHVLGYLGKPQTNPKDEEIDFDQAGHRAFSQPNMIGKSGIELSMERYLQGTPGLREIRFNAAGLKEAEIRNTSPLPGNNIILSIDQRIQKIVEETFAGYRGACVVLDPNNGDILAMASVPAYDPNLFIPRIKSSDWETLSKDSQQPLVNRAIYSDYSPGSSFKVIVALKALEENIISPSTTIECTGQFFLGGGKPRECWEKSGHGNMNLREAITMSCNVYFYNLGQKLGGPNLWSMAEAFGLGQKTGIPLMGEYPGLVIPPDIQKHKNRESSWTPGNSVSMAVGQGILQTTPLQMAVVAAAFANGGTVYRPRLILRVETPEGEITKNFSSTIYNHISASPQNIQLVREAMLNVVENGTGKRAAVEKIKIAGKTGTAQYGDPVRETRAWMISFAPYEKPQYAIAIVAETSLEDAGGRTAAPFVSTIYKKLFRLGKEQKGPLHPPVPIAAIPVSEDEITGVEGEVSGKLLEDTNLSDKPLPKEESMIDEDEEENKTSSRALPAEKVNP